MPPMEFQKGCPVCERIDPELERELQALAQLLFDAYLLDCKDPDPQPGIIDKLE